MLTQPALCASDLKDYVYYTYPYPATSKGSVYMNPSHGSASPYIIIACFKNVYLIQLC